MAAHLPASAVKFQFQIDLLSNRERPGDLEKATDICKQWCQSEPRSVQPYFRLMQLYWKSGQANQTQALADRVADLDPGHRLTPHYQAVSLQLNGDLQSALKCHRTALLRNTNQEWSETELDLEVAIAAFEVAAGHYPASPGVDEDALIEAKINCDSFIMGVPVLTLDADMVDTANWSHEAMTLKVETFLQERGLA